RQDAVALDRRIRALPCFLTHGAETLRVVEAEPADGEGAPGLVLDTIPRIATGRGTLRLLRLQRAGGKPLPAADFLRGYPLPPGEILP
ncbi:MAG: methionyl-tRNA formyltransferase, partial [Pseudomonadota bacterium]